MSVFRIMLAFKNFDEAIAHEIAGRETEVFLRRPIVNDIVGASALRRCEIR